MSDPKSVVDQLDALYREATGALRDALRAYLRDGTKPDLRARLDGAFTYPQLRVQAPAGPRPRVSRAYARLNAAGAYATTVTRPDFFRTYLTEQLELLVRDYGVTLEVGRSQQEIPFPYVLDGSALEGADAEDLARWFPTTELAHIGDEIADGVWEPALEGARPLSLFDGLRTDFSCSACATTWARRPSTCSPSSCSPTTTATSTSSCAGPARACRRGAVHHPVVRRGAMLTPETADPQLAVADGAWRRHQMPATT
jgi:AMP nucleosidase